MKKLNFHGSMILDENLVLHHPNEKINSCSGIISIVDGQEKRLIFRYESKFLHYRYNLPATPASMRKIIHTINQIRKKRVTA